MIEKVAENIVDLTIYEHGKLILKTGLDYNKHQLIHFDINTQESIPLCDEGIFKLQEVYSNGNTIWSRKWEGGSIFLNKSELKIRETNKLLCTFIEKELALAIHRDSQRNKHFILFNTSNNEIIWEHELSSTLWHIENKSIYFIPFTNRKRLSLNKIDIKTGKNLWSIDLSDQEKKEGITIEKILGIIEDKLVLALSNSKIVTINKHKGERTLDIKVSIPNLYMSHMENSSVFNLHGKIFGEFNLTTKSENTNVHDNMFFSKSFVSNRNKQKVYFLGQNDKSDYIDRYIGSYDRNSNSIEWSKEINMIDDDNLITIKQSKMEIYVLSAKGILYKVTPDNNR
jgi:hypothetical protein